MRGTTHGYAAAATVGATGVRCAVPDRQRERERETVVACIWFMQWRRGRCLVAAAAVAALISRQANQSSNNRTFVRTT